MKKIAYILLLLTTLPMACTQATGPTQHDEARAAAEAYYAYLIAGEYDKYVSSIFDSDSMSADYRRELTTLMAQFMAEQMNARRGIANAKAVSDTIVDDQADVRLELTYGDSTREQIDVPLINIGGIWKLQ